MIVHQTSEIAREDAPDFVGRQYSSWGNIPILDLLEEWFRPPSVLGWASGYRGRYLEDGEGSTEIHLV